MNQLDYKRLVALGYDKIGETYGRQATRYSTNERAKYEASLVKGLEKGNLILDLGCGSGIPTTRRLARKFKVTAVDISVKQIERARVNVPDASFICCDMMALELPSSTFNGVGAFYSIMHLPRQEHRSIFRRITSWLKPGGLFVGSLGITNNEVELDSYWKGIPLFSSAYDTQTNQQIIEEAGLRIMSAAEEITTNKNNFETFLWIIAQKPENS